MGYRSNVAYTIRFVGDDDAKNRQSFYTFIAEAKAKEETKLCFDESESRLKIDEVKLQLNFDEQSTKWYSDYPSVKCHEELLSQAMEWVDDGHEEIAYRFLRVGEEANDIDDDWGGDWQDEWVGLTRSISFDWDSDEK